MDPKLDRAQLEELKSVMRDDFPTFVTEVVENMTNHMSALRLALKQQDLEAARAAAHPLGSNSSYLGLVGVQKLAKAIETIADKQNKENSPDILAIMPSFEKLEKEFKTIMPVLLEEVQKL